MAVVPIYNCYHPVLRKKTAPVLEINDEVKQVVNNLFDTLYNISNGVGLAANQIGAELSIVVIDVSIADMDDDDYDDEESMPERPKAPMTLINPEILEYSDEESEEQEGCLSIPEFYEKIVRPEAIKVRYFDLAGNEIIKDVDGFLARVMQHEIDHLNGILFIDKMTPLRRTLAKNKLRRIERGMIITKYPMINPDGTLQEEY